MLLLLYSTNRPRVPLGVITPKLGHLDDKTVLKSNKGIIQLFNIHALPGLTLSIVAAVAQWWSVGLVIKNWLLTPGSILVLAMRRCVLGKDTLRLSPLGPSNPPVVVVQPDKRLANRTKKRCSALVWLDRRRVPDSYERTNKLTVDLVPLGVRVSLIKNPVLSEKNSDWLLNLVTAKYLLTSTEASFLNRRY